MAITKETLENTLKELGVDFEVEGNHYIHSSRGRFAPVINTILTIDEDGSGITIMSTLPDRIAPERRSAVCELLNFVHGQNLWNVRFHLDDTGRVFSVGKFMLWGRPFNSIQFGDILFTLLVTTDRLSPPLVALNEKGKSPDSAFELFFLQSDSAKE